MTTRRRFGQTGLLAAVGLLAAGLTIVVSGSGAAAGGTTPTYPSPAMTAMTARTAMTGMTARTAMTGMPGMTGTDRAAAQQRVDLRDVVRAAVATAPFHSIAAAKRAGYTVLFKDRLGFTCIQDISTPSQGGMGLHFVNPAYIGSTDPAHPAAV